MSVINFVLAHQAIFAALGVAIMDLIFAVSPSVQSNGLLHLIYMELKSLVIPTQPPAPPAA